MTQGNNSKGFINAPGRLSSFLVHTPNTKSSFFLLILSHSIFFLFLFKNDSNIGLNHYIRETNYFIELTVLSISSFLIPALLSPYLASKLSYLWDGRYPLRYGFQTGSVGITLASLSILIGSFFGTEEIGLLFGFGLISSVWYLTLRTHGNAPEWIAFSFAFITSFASIVGLCLTYEWPSSFFDNSIFTFGFVSALSFTFASFLYLFFVDYPYKQAIGVSGIHHMAAYIEFFSTGNGERLMRALSKISESVSVRSSWVSIRISKKPLAFFAIPGIHPGPIGNFGGSNLPSKIESFLPGLSFAFHGANFNDHNPIHSEDIDRIGKAMTAASETTTYTPNSFSFTHSGGNPSCYSIGLSNAILLFSEPENSDDIHPELATLIENQNPIEGIKKLFVDLHTQEVSGHIVSPLHIGTAEGFILEQASAFCSEKTSTNPHNSFRAGVSKLDCGDLNAGIGPCGLRTIVFEIGNETTAILLWDSNGFSSGLRDRLKLELGGIADNLILSTTDNHFVNKKPGGENPLRHSKTLVSNASNSIMTALNNLKDAEASSGRIITNNVEILGHGKQDSITGAVNATVQVARYSWFPIYGSAFMFCLLIYL